MLSRGYYYPRAVFLPTGDDGAVSWPAAGSSVLGFAGNGPENGPFLFSVATRLPVLSCLSIYAWCDLVSVVWLCLLSGFRSV